MTSPQPAAQDDRTPVTSGAAARCAWIAALLLMTAGLSASELFVEAESFQCQDGWKIVDGAAAKTASGVAMLGGGTGDPRGVARRWVNIKDAGRYRVWVRYASHPKWRGPFRLAAMAAGREIGGALFDADFEGKSPRDTETWRSFDVDLPEGEVLLTLSKHEQRNAPGGARLVDCVLLTMDDKLVPNHLRYGAQTFVRVTIGEACEKPLYIHIFADHFHAPWYQHYSLGRSGATAGVAPKKDELLRRGEQTAWCNLTPMIYQDSGAALHITARHSYPEQAERLQATFEFATAPEETAIVRTIRADFQPSGFAVFLPPNLLTKENVALLKTSHEIAEETGKLADAHAWPVHGRKPEQFPFFATVSHEHSAFRRDAALNAREQKTLDYFAFTGEHLRRIGGVWFMRNGSYCQPDIETMQARAAADAAEFQRAGGDVKRVVFCELTDEPTGQPLETIANDAAYQARFQAWLKANGETPERLLVRTWDDVRIVADAQRETSPALYYFSQRFRTRALGDFMAAQRKVLERAYGGSFPVLANFSDGAVYGANFYLQGVDYFELLDAPDQNAIWGEDWSNGASTYQCGSFNVDLMRAAARDRGQIIGHHLVAHAGRKPWDVKLKATSELARGVKIMNNFCYGPSWASHEGGPYWRSHLWYAKPETWTPYASITREVGAVEDLLVDAMPAPARVALLYSSSSDVWTIGKNFAHGFERMHTWLALAHAQVPVDIVSERQLADGALEDHDVCYLSGPNLTRAAAERLKAWVERGGTLWLTAGAAARDEFDRPLDLLDEILPAVRADAATMQPHVSSGRYLRVLAQKDEVSWPGGAASVLSVKQSLAPRSGGEVIATFRDHSAALVRGDAGAGHVYCAGFLPALDYIKRALDARSAVEEKVSAGTSSASDTAMIERSANPWDFPAAVRQLILTPVRAARVAPPVECGVPLVDAVWMRHEKGVLVPLANYTNQPIALLTLRIAVPKRILHAESAVHGPIGFRQSADRAELSLPLENNDYVKLYFE